MERKSYVGMERKQKGYGVEIIGWFIGRKAKKI